MSAQPAESSEPHIADAADVSRHATVGAGTCVWDLATVREGARIGDRCVLGRGVYVDADVEIGDRTKIQNNAQVFKPARLGSDVFIGPGVILTNDRTPRASTLDSQPKRPDDWTADAVVIEDGASVGAGSVVLAGIRVGAHALIGAGAVVVDDVADHALVVGNPARHVGWVGVSGRRLERHEDRLVDVDTGAAYRVSDDEQLVRL